MQMHDGILHPARFCGRFLKLSKINNHPAERKVLALLHLLKITHALLAIKKSSTYKPDSPRWNGSLRPKHCTEGPSVLLSYSPVSSEDQESKRARCGLRPVVASVRHADYRPRRVVTTHCPTCHTLGKCSTGSVASLCACASDSCWFFPVVRWFHKDREVCDLVSCSWILCKLPELTIVIAVSAYLLATPVNLAEYTGMNNGAQADSEHNVHDLIIVGGSRLAI